MNSTAREKFSIEAPVKILAGLRKITKALGLRFQGVVDRAPRDHIDCHP